MSFCEACSVTVVIMSQHFALLYIIKQDAGNHRCACMSSCPIGRICIAVLFSRVSLAMLMNLYYYEFT